MPYEIPARIWICPDPECDSRFPERWRLVRHLEMTHRLRKRRAEAVAERCEYVLSGRYVRNPIYRIPDDAEDIDEDE
jgi:hypothetical protein